MSKKTPFAAALCFGGSLLSAETHRISPDRYYTTFSAAHPPWPTYAPATPWSLNAWIRAAVMKQQVDPG
jgi:hypothetical protein